MMSTASDAREWGWSLHERIEGLVAVPVEKLRSAIQATKAPTDLIAAADPAHFQRAAMLGLAAVTDLSLDLQLPEPIRSACRTLPQHYHELLSLLQPSAHALQAAGPDIRHISPIEGVTGLLGKAVHAANPSSSVGVAAVGGATLGTLILPGIGTAVGGAIGALLGGSQATKRDRRALDHFAAALQMSWSALNDVHHSLWNQIVRSTVEAGGPRLPDSAFFETAEVRWTEVKAAHPFLLLPPERESFRTAVLDFLRDWGPLAEALYVAGQTCLPPYLLQREELASWVEQHRRLYPSDPRGYENAAYLALETGAFESARNEADLGLQQSPQHVGCRQALIETLAALGRISEAEDRIRAARIPGTAPPPEMALIRGLMRGQRPDAARERVRAWIARDRKPALVAQKLRAFPCTAELLASESILDELAALPSGPAGLLQASIERHLPADGSQRFHGEPTGDKAAHARQAFLHLEPDERVLYFHDWSLWHNAKTGFALTTQRLIWKQAWQESTAIAWTEVVRSELADDAEGLRIGSRHLPLDDEVMRTSLFRVLREAQHFFRE